jgi:hypothetical protein
MKYPTVKIGKKPMLREAQAPQEKFQAYNRKYANNQFSNQLQQQEQLN